MIDPNIFTVTYTKPAAAATFTTLPLVSFWKMLPFKAKDEQ